VVGPAGPGGSAANTGATGPTGAAGSGGGSGGGGYTGSSTPPASPTPGYLWYDLTTGILSIWIDDGNSTQWVQVAPPLAGPTGPGGGGSGGAVTLLLPGWVV
jgi:hypothetical protein